LGSLGDGYAPQFAERFRQHASILSRIQKAEGSAPRVAHEYRLLAGSNVPAWKAWPRRFKGELDRSGTGIIATSKNSASMASGFLPIHCLMHR
jgi:hypothetical protein